MSVSQEHPGDPCSNSRGHSHVCVRHSGSWAFRPATYFPRRSLTLLRLFFQVPSSRLRGLCIRSSIFLPLTLQRGASLKTSSFHDKIRKLELCNGEHVLSSVDMTPVNNKSPMSPPKEASPSPSLPSSSAGVPHALDSSSPPQVSALRALHRCEDDELPMLLPLPH